MQSSATAAQNLLFRWLYVYPSKNHNNSVETGIIINQYFSGNRLREKLVLWSCCVLWWSTEISVDAYIICFFFTGSSVPSPWYGNFCCAAQIYINTALETKYPGFKKCYIVNCRAWGFVLLTDQNWYFVSAWSNARRVGWYPFNERFFDFF